MLANPRVASAGGPGVFPRRTRRGIINRANTNRICIVFASAILLLASMIGASAADPRRIFFLESLSPAQPAAVRTIEAFKRRLSEITNEKFEIFVDYMELVRFS